MTAVNVRDTFCNLGRMEIPRPTYQGLQFIPTRGRIGFYKSIRQHGAQYGLQIRNPGPRRAQLNPDIFRRPDTVIEEETSDSSPSPVPAPRRAPQQMTVSSTSSRLPARSDDDDSNRSSQLSDYSSDKSKCSSPEAEPEVPAPDYDEDSPTDVVEKF